MDNRLVAAKVLRAVRRGGSLDRELEQQLRQTPADSPAAVQALVYGVLRQHERIEALLRRLLRKPLKAKDAIITDLLAIGLFELLDAQRPPHAVINGVVAQVKKQRQWASGLSNAVLRNFDRDRDALLAAADSRPEAQYLLPGWLLQRLQNDWPEHWQAAAAASAQAPPMTLRVNLQQTSRSDYLAELEAVGLPATADPVVESAITLTTPCAVELLPGFAAGRVTVQDAAAQLAVLLLDIQPGQRILDACAAPGGKTTHMHERSAGKAAITALEVSVARSQRLQDNLQRAGCAARIINADAAAIDEWWNGTAFDRVLLDVPCSATGVIRRHPDIKLHRTEQDITSLLETQQGILRQVWKTLAPGGIMLYATCSVLKAENASNISRFCAEQRDAAVVPLECSWGLDCEVGRQVLPGQLGMDGFFYALLTKKA